MRSIRRISDVSSTVLSSGIETESPEGLKGVVIVMLFDDIGSRNGASLNPVSGTCTKVANCCVASDAVDKRY